MKSKVAVLKTSPGTVIDDYAALMRLAGSGEALPRDRNTNLIIDAHCGVWYPACSTEPWQLEGVVKALIDDGYSPESLTLLAGRSDGYGRAGEVNNGYAAVAERYGLGFTRLSDPSVRWTRFQPQADTSALDRICGRNGITIPEDLLNANTVFLPVMRSDSLTVTAGAMVSAPEFMLEQGSKPAVSEIHEVLVDLLAVRKEIDGGLFAVMDGSICGNGPGPRRLRSYEKGYILAGADPVAVDAVAARMMGFDPMEIKYINLAHERGLGCGVFEEIEIAGEDVSGVNFQFGGGTGSAKSSPGHRPWPGKSMLSGLLAGRTAADQGTASRLYSDLIWYPFAGRRHVDDMAETKWGQLLQTYLPPEASLDHQGEDPGRLILCAAAALAAVSAAARILRLARRDS